VIAEPAGKPLPQQQFQAGQDGYNAAGNISITNIYGTGAGGTAASTGKIWGGVPARNPSFTGREELLDIVRNAMARGDRAVVQALHGQGGVGKTQLAIEYAHRFTGDYDVVWWVNSDDPALIAGQFAMLATELACAPEGAPVEVVRRAVLGALHARDRWLLVFDNVERPDHVADWLPGGTGHVVITSRAPGWHEFAVPVQVDVFSRAESRAFLQRRVPGLSGAEAKEVAAAVGDLPLAVAQAAGYMADTGIPAGEYVSLLRNRPVDILLQGKPWAYPRSLAAATRLSFEHVLAADPVTAEVAAICAFLAPEPVPAEWFPRAADQLPSPLRDQVRDPLAWRQVIARLRDSALVRVNPDGLVMHRLTQAVLRDHTDSERATASRDMAIAIVLANRPGDTGLPSTWPDWARMLPHLLVLDPSASESVDLRYMGNDAAWYLIWRGDAKGAQDLAVLLLERWRDRFGPDDPQTLLAATAIAAALYGLGRYDESRATDEDTLARRRRLLGDDHPDTLWSAHNLAVDLRGLGEFAAARVLDEETLARRRRLLGDDHPATLSSECSLAVDLGRLGEFAAARVLDEDALTRFRRLLGNDDLDALRVASSLAFDLRGLGEFAAARVLDEDTLARRRRLLGNDHPDTRQSEQNLAEDLRLLGEEA
jgi:hypothetical protein